MNRPSRILQLGRHQIDDASEAYVIAEIGNNHQGSVKKAIELFQAAKAAGVQAVKLQKRDNRTLYTRAAFNKPYENEHSFGATYGEHREYLEFGADEYRELKAVADDLKLDFFATAFDYPSADFLAELDPPAYKIASGDLCTTPLLRHVAKLGKPMIVSVGGGTFDDIVRAYDLIMPINPRLCFLHCTATYPTNSEDMNLRVISRLRETFPELVIGLSDHYNGIAMSPVAYVLGARVFEKHFTMNHTWKGTDHAFSLEPNGMHKMVRDLQRVRLALGDGVKQMLPQEKPAIAKMGKSLFARRDLRAGAVLTEGDVAMKSPGDVGLPAYELDHVIGRTLGADLAEDEPLRGEHLR